jgi:transforming growth factor-beta-induced protein
MSKLIALAVSSVAIVGAGFAFAGDYAKSGECTKSASACTEKSAAVMASANYDKKKDIVDTAVAAGSFNTLAAALKAADLVDTLKGEGPFTVFAPTDEAFAKLPAGTVETLLKPENKDKLKGILTYHVVAGNVKAADVVTLSEAKTVNGKAVTVKVTDGKVFLNGSTQVVKTDIETTNGVIHVIDTVLLPAE